MPSAGDRRRIAEGSPGDRRTIQQRSPKDRRTIARDRDRDRDRERERDREVLSLARGVSIEGKGTRAMTVPSKPEPDSVRSGLIELLPGSKPAIERLWASFLEQMLILFYPPFRAETDDELLRQSVVALNAWVDDLGEFDAKTLEAGWRAVRRAHRTPRWPVSGDVRAACLDACPKRAQGPKTMIGADGKVIPFWREASKDELEILAEAGPPFSAHSRVTDAFLERARDAIAARGRSGSAA